MSNETFLAGIIDPAVFAWQDRAVCAQVGDLDLFFPDTADGTSEMKDSLAQVRSMCSSCPVQRECAFMSLGERFGIWAGANYTERKRWRQAAYGDLGLEAVSRLTFAAMKEHDGDIDAVIAENPTLTQIPVLQIRVESEADNG